MAKVRIVYFNRWAKGTLLAKSSQHPQFPMECTQYGSPKYFWRTRYGTNSGNGLFVVTDSNKYIDFDEGGAELTATLTTGNYNGATLAAEIASKMTAAGGQTYSCTYSESTAKFTISAASNFTLRWLTGTNKTTDISDLCGFDDSANDTGANTYTSDYRRIHWPNAYVDIDLGQAVSVNSLALLNHNISASAVIKLYGADDSGFTTGVTEDTIAHNTADIFFYLSAARTKRYFRVYVSDPTNPNSYIQIGPIFLGSYWAPSRHYTTGYQEGRDDRSEIDQTDDGVIVSVEKPATDAWELSFSGLNDTDKEAALALLEECGIHSPFWLCLDYDAPNADSYLVNLEDTTYPENVHANNWNWQISVKEFV